MRQTKTVFGRGLSDIIWAGYRARIQSYKGVCVYVDMTGVQRLVMVFERKISSLWYRSIFLLQKLLFFVLLFLGRESLVVCD